MGWLCHAWKKGSYQRRIYLKERDEDQVVVQTLEVLTPYVSWFGGHMEVSHQSFYIGTPTDADPFIKRRIYLSILWVHKGLYIFFRPLGKYAGIEFKRNWREGV